jgi:hypothetical protein
MRRNAFWAAWADLKNGKNGKNGSGKPCRCGQARCGDVTIDGLIHKHHFYDKCAEMVVIDETRTAWPLTKR